MKVLLFYRCRWCGKMWEQGLTTAKNVGMLATSKLHSLEDITSWHYCDKEEERVGISDLVGVREDK